MPRRCLKGDLSVENRRCRNRRLATLPWRRPPHSKKQIQQIGRSIERFGFTNPILVSEDNEILAGHRRVEAAMLLGMKRVPTVRLAQMSESEPKAHILADNNLALNPGWDRGVLAVAHRRSQRATTCRASHQFPLEIGAPA
jgi:ParB-like chromosome segregation protein Spo0J